LLISVANPKPTNIKQYMIIFGFWSSSHSLKTFDYNNNKIIVIIIRDILIVTDMTLLKTIENAGLTPPLIILARHPNSI
jgi:hypothetical protein